jgi:cytochrome b
MVATSDVTAAKVPADMATTSQAKVLAWDLPTRLAKWTLAILVGLAFATKYYGDESLVWHMRNGLAILVVLLFRLLWGLVGGSTARFANFLRGPVAAVSYIASTLRGRPPHYLGHNPLGGWMVVALLLLVGAQALTGLFTTDDIMVDGPLALVVDSDIVERASALHGQIFEILLWLIGLHVAANILYSLIGSDNLILAMVTGSKPKGTFVDRAPATPGSILLALACLIAAAGVVFGGIALAGGDPFP